MIGRGLLLAGLSLAAPLVAAHAQTLDAFDPVVSCTFDLKDAGEPLKSFCREGSVEQGDLLKAAKQSQKLWQLVRPATARLNLLEVSGNQLIVPVSVDQLGKLSDAARERYSRAETAVFLDPGTGSLFVDVGRLSGGSNDYAANLEIGMERSLGLALLSGYPAIKRVLVERTAASDILVAQFEGIASFPSLVAADADDLESFSLSRDFSEEFFLPEAGWGNAAFWKGAFVESKRLFSIESKAFFTWVFSALGAAADDNADDAGSVLAYLDAAFSEEMGWSRFDGDGFGPAYAAVMAAHQLDQRLFQSPERETDLIVSSSMVSEWATGSVAPFATEFLQLNIAATQLRETELSIKVCEVIGDDTCVESDDIRLIFEGEAIDPRTGLKAFSSRRGDMVQVLGGNRLSMILPGRREAFGAEDNRYFELKLGVANLQVDRTANYRIFFDLITLEPSCDWASMASTLNPWWRGDLQAPGSLTPDLSDLPPDMRMELSEGLRSNWYLSEGDYREVVGFEELVFDETAGKAASWRAPENWNDAEIPDLWRQGPDKSDADRIFARLMPSSAKVSISGAVEDAGTVCVSPLTSVGIPDLAVLAEGDEAAILESMGLPPELATAKTEAEAMQAILGAMDTDAPFSMAEQSDVMLQIYSPNLFTQQFGFIPSGAIVPLVHGGQGGWRSNAGFNIYVRLPDTAPEDLRPGAFQVEALLIPDVDTEEDDIGAYPPFYVWGDTRAEGEIDFEDYIAPRMTGELVIKRQVEGAFIASLELSGATHRRRPTRTIEEPELEPVGSTSIRIDRMFVLGLSEGETLPVQNMFNLVTARVPANLEDVP